ncbi:MAG: MBL fold metallo-hydrolase [Deltaproteobacteria bacterium]|nr:MBL fold metallo-hydrolase [Deltaproteobacteria bacterium]
MADHHSDFIVTILGSGTCVPSLRRSSCSALLETATGTKLLFDSGPGTMRRLLEANTTIFDLSFIFYSHFHPDHTAELVPLLFATKYPDSDQRKIPLTIVAGKGFLDFFKGLRGVYGTWIEISPELFRIVELDIISADTRKFDDFTVTSMPVEHREESIAYRITVPGGESVVYSGDTDYSENLIMLARGADLLICESALPDDLKVEGHLTPSRAGKIAAKADVRKLVLTHFYPECDQVDVEKECRKTFGGPLILAEDLMRIEVG